MIWRYSQPVIYCVDGHISKSLMDIDRIRAVLVRNGEQFRFYEDQHRSGGPKAEGRAATDGLLALRCENAVKDIDGTYDGGPVKESSLKHLALGQL